MHIGFAGAGAIGCHYGSRLFQTKHEILLLARGQHLQALQHDGLLHESGAQHRRINIPATAEHTQLSQCPIIIFTCKMTALHALINSLKTVIQPHCMLVSMQNGVQAPDMLAAAFPQHTIIAASAFIGARLAAPGHIIHSAAGGLRMGLWQHGPGDPLLPQLCTAFQLADVPCRIDTDPAAMLWRKMLWNCGFNAITAITRRYAKEIAAHPETLTIVQQAMQETIRVASGCGIAINAADMHKHIATTLSMGAVKTSMWQDIEAGHRTEIDYMNAYVANLAESMQLAAPTNRWLSSLIHSIEQNPEHE